MFPTAIRLSNAVRVTLFTRAGCGLCDTAKHTVTQLHKRRPFEYTETDIALPSNKPWKDVYDFDVPVLHVQTVKQDTSLSDPKKLFHRWTEQEMETLITEAENKQC
ncbi:glutaredoxin family protein [Aspergillus homomorphus CBS 101889]|uniref:Glutaredoxin-like protein n=1 Tax=Aspergillus homomorphus (strain CBS 101889) TaxID=1450537 RepID=A0A395HUA0_ASPHC|nr:glutaredoxin [Aspergillus homomorphus CBS 101889]RAL10408.1 glutaredoxin [Aspergillus homomorphus CBS 101889]